MRKLTRAFTGTAATGAAIVAAVALAAAPAFATVNTATVSGNTNSDGSFSATATGPTLTDSKTKVKLTCASATASGIAKNGTYTAGAPNAISVASLTTLKWNQCTISGIGFSVTANATPWSLNATGATDSTGDVTPGSITGVNASLTGACNATVTGAVTGTYTNSTHTLAINAGSLTVSGVSGLCLGLINNGDAVVYNANYVVTPATLAVNAT
ncbi:hypothetical protein [Actinacidiphila epipremni]|uniref:Uncharacterized protein n=1 Tax=Actinacidiphila epipremni TaxID=2053013 RepID=A0ABX0ZNS8_9ACTN|nr:hypothetical protein [Actinacidiphila epipremni]NJP44670.1 hypothetical protein [Actinacidiphila epipremni]